jgi:hypothetical protein
MAPMSYDSYPHPFPVQCIAMEEKEKKQFHRLAPTSLRPSIMYNHSNLTRLSTITG